MSADVTPLPCHPSSTGFHPLLHIEWTADYPPRMNLIVIFSDADHL